MKTLSFLFIVFKKQILFNLKSRYIDIILIQFFKLKKLLNASFKNIKPLGFGIFKLRKNQPIYILSRHTFKHSNFKYKTGLF